MSVSPTPRLSTAALALLLIAAPMARAENAVMFLGSWGLTGSHQGRVYRYVSGTTWTELSPPAGLGDAVWDLEWFDGKLWASTHVGPNSDRNPSVHHGNGGRVFFYDGLTWTDVSPPGGFDAAVTSVSALEGRIYATVDDIGLVRWEGGNSWTTMGTFQLAAQALVSDSHEGRPMLYLGQDNTDEFWFYDPSGLTTCSTPTGFGCQVPVGDVCSADCHPGSCIHALAEFDDGAGPLVYGGAWVGRLYRWNPGTHQFVTLPSLPYQPVSIPPPPAEGLLHIQGLASYHGRLWAGISDGKLWSSADPSASSATWAIELNYGTSLPFSELLAVPADDLLWEGFGGTPWRWARRTGTSHVRTYDGVNTVERAVPGLFGEGVLVLAAVLPEVTCDAGPEQVIECTGDAVEVTLDGSASDVPAALGLRLTYDWSGPFIEGTATGPSPLVHFPGVGDYPVTLHVAAGSASATCTTTIHVVDTRPPTFVGQEACLWPPNHRYRCFSASDFTADGTGIALDECEGEVTVRIVGVSSSQAEDQGPGGDGHTQDDMVFDEDQVCVRSERLGDTQEGRTYTIVLAATDAAGNATTVTTQLHVPHDQREARRCGPRPPDVGLLPHAPLPLDGLRREGTYAPPARLPGH